MENTTYDKKSIHQLVERNKNAVYRLALVYCKNQSVYLYYYQGYSLVEVANLMGKNQNTIRTYLFRARKQLKDVLEKEEFTWNAE